MKSLQKPTLHTLRALHSLFITVWISTFMLAGCGSIPTSVRTETTPQQDKTALADSLARDGKYDAASALYLELALANPSPLKDKYQLRAAELAMQANNPDNARQYSSMLSEQSLDTKERVRRRILASRLAIVDGNHQEAQKLLSDKLLVYAPEYTEIILQLRAQAQVGSNQPLAAVKTYNSLLAVQDNPAARRFTEQALWRLLSGVGHQDLDLWKNQTSDTQLKGWIELAEIKRSRYLSATQLNQALEQWRARNPQHPASNDLTVAIIEEWESYFVMPDKIAVLLPMTGAYAALAEVIYSGILTAREASTDRSFSPEIRLYDIGDNPQNVLSYYQKAVQEGAEFVIGPLSKEAVNLLASAKELPVPVLTLNYGDSYVVPAPNLFQFGLLPEDEAMQVAERASIDNRHAAVVLAPANEWGSRLVDAFLKRYREIGGYIAQVERYRPEDTDYSVPIKSILQLDESEVRYKQLRNVLNRNIEFEPQRREDVDLIFLIATPQNARLLKPQINYYYATDLPVYSTSHIFSGVENISIDQDINGVTFCDIPWVIQPTVEHQLFKELLELRAGQNYQLLPRFAALGIDALQIIPNLKQLAALPHERFDGATGTLRITNQNRIYRELNWAMFKNGRPARIDYDPASGQP